MKSCLRESLINKYPFCLNKKEHKSKNIIKKSLARLIAVQSLYQYEFYGRDKELVILRDELVDNYLLSDLEENLTSYRDRVDLELLEKLSSGIVLTLPKIDQEISSFLRDDNKLNDVSDVILQIIRLAFFELKYMKDVPLKVVINEYVDIAGCFYDIQKVKFVNSILENIAGYSRKEELLAVKNNEKKQ